MRRLIVLIEKIDQAANNFRWGNTYGLARTLLATGLLLTLLCNDVNLLFHPLGEDSPSSFIQTLDLANINLFNLMDGHLEAAKWISVGILVLVAIGWYPRITGLLHWWVAFSFANTAMVLDGGDQIAQVLTLLLVPFCLADPRKWHWQPWPAKGSAQLPFYQKALNLLALSSLKVIALQVALIYLHAGIGKLAVEEWANGTAMFYWIQNPIFGVAGEPHGYFIHQIFANPYLVSLATWGVIVFELLLFMALVMNRKHHKPLLILGLVFHFLNIVLFGLVSFFFTMAAALFLYLGPNELNTSFNFSIRKERFQRIKSTDLQPLLIINKFKKIKL